MWGRKRIRGPKIIIAPKIALIDFNQTVFRLGDAETETVIFNDFFRIQKQKSAFFIQKFRLGRTDGRTEV
jgi:hypothetical protein